MKQRYVIIKMWEGTNGDEESKVDDFCIDTILVAIIKKNYLQKIYSNDKIYIIKNERDGISKWKEQKRVEKYLIYIIWQYCYV